MDRVSKETRSKIMSSIKSKNTSIELKMQKILPKGFVKHYKYAFNCDFAYVEEKIAIFVDGNFWHGKDFEIKKEKYSEHWRKHIRGNIERDKKNRKILIDNGWEVKAYWEDDVNDDTNTIADEVSALVVLRRKSKPKNYQQLLFK